MNTFRYQPLNGGVMARNDDGDWVCIRDHIRVTAERDALQLRLNAVEEENDRLRSALRTIRNHTSVSGNQIDMIDEALEKRP